MTHAQTSSPLCMTSLHSSPLSCVEKTTPTWPASTARGADWPRLAGAWGRLGDPLAPVKPAWRLHSPLVAPVWPSLGPCHQHRPSLGRLSSHALRRSTRPASLRTCQRSWRHTGPASPVGTERHEGALEVKSKTCQKCAGRQRVPWEEVGKARDTHNFAAVLRQCVFRRRRHICGNSHPPCIRWRCRERIVVDRIGHRVPAHDRR